MSIRSHAPPGRGRFLTHVRRVRVAPGSTDRVVLRAAAGRRYGLRQTWKVWVVSSRTPQVSHAVGVTRNTVPVPRTIV